MEPYVTVAIFTLPTEVPIARAKLESEGITCRIIDQYTIEVYHFISNGVGGIKLQVPASEFETAKVLLIEGGFLPVDSQVKASFIERHLQNLRTRYIVSRLIVGFLIVALAVFIGIVAYAKINRPEPILAVLNHEWCVDHFIYKDKIYYPATIANRDESESIQVRIVERCNGERLIIRQDGSLALPGYYGPAISGRWDRDAGRLKFGNLDTLAEVFGGYYTLEQAYGSLKLKSEHTEIVCYKNSYFIGL